MHSDIVHARTAAILITKAKLFSPKQWVGLGLPSRTVVALTGPVCCTPRSPLNTRKTVGDLRPVKVVGVAATSFHTLAVTTPSPCPRVCQVRVAG